MVWVREAARRHKAGGEQCCLGSGCTEQLHSLPVVTDTGLCSPANPEPLGPRVCTTEKSLGRFQCPQSFTTNQCGAGSQGLWKRRGGQRARSLSRS